MSFWVSQKQAKLNSLLADRAAGKDISDGDIAVATYLYNEQVGIAREIEEKRAAVLFDKKLKDAEKERREREARELRWKNLDAIGNVSQYRNDEDLFSDSDSDSDSDLNQDFDYTLEEVDISTNNLAWNAIKFVEQLKEAKSKLLEIISFAKKDDIGDLLNPEELHNAAVDLMNLIKPEDVSFLEDAVIGLLTRAANVGYENSMVELGHCYLYGRGGAEKNANNAVYWYSKAANSGNATAMRNLGWCLRNGSGIEKDDIKAFYWSEKSANAGDIFGMDDLAWCYRKGLGTSISTESAWYWYKKSAKEGNSTAITNIGEMYAEGFGVEVDEKMAIKWFQLAASHGQVDAIAELKNRNIEILKNDN